MKNIHPKYFNKATIKCVCGKVFHIGSAVENSEIEICGSCHPFYTGQAKFIDVAGRIEKFKARREKATTTKIKTKKTATKKNKATKKPKPKKSK
ncbi:MAG: 50S ribosomal protein L31 [Candidatus Liptonbacteria bacterium]|nr:50S ribosomal protein L31 [Candidatus Liptonbacteria bacterium]